jgi:hypothetical protein
VSKFQRVFKLEVQGKSLRTYTFQNPLTVVFDINRHAFGSGNCGTFTLYNLRAEARNDIQHDNAIDPPREFKFEAGYLSEGVLSVLFKGSLQTAFSYRDGPDVLTEMRVLDGGTAIQYAQVELTVRELNRPDQDVLTLMNLMGKYGVKPGALGTVVQQMKQRTRPVTWIGSVWDILKRMAYTGGGYPCIDMGKAYLMAQNDVLPAMENFAQLDSSTGLLGTPRRSGWSIEADMVLEPRIQLMQLLNVASTVEPSITGKYSVQAINHRGMISAAKGGAAVTSLRLQQVPTQFNLVTPLVATT